MTRWLAATASIFAFSLAACSSGALPGGGIERFGLSESAVDHPTVRAAVETANAILGSDAKNRFVLGWQAESAKGGVPVYAVGVTDLSREEIMSTYAECGCVVVKLSALNAWEQSHVGTGEALLDIEPRLLLAYMLLHEMGHVENGDLAGSIDQAGSPVGAAVNLDPTEQKDREEKADAFAARAIQSGMTDTATDRGLVASEVSMALTQLSYNLLEHRLLDDFGGTELSKPTLFWDRGTTHPNLEWRVLVVNNLIAPTPETQTLLDDFEARRFGGEPTPLGN